MCRGPVQWASTVINRNTTTFPLQSDDTTTVGFAAATRFRTEPNLAESLGDFRYEAGNLAESLGDFRYAAGNSAESLGDFRYEAGSLNTAAGRFLTSCAS